MEWFAQKGAVLRIGQQPLRFDINDDIDGVTFAECYARRVEADIDATLHQMITSYAFCLMAGRRLRVQSVRRGQWLR